MLRVARKSVEKQQGEQPVDVIEFVLGQERYAVEVRSVREVCPVDEELNGANSRHAVNRAHLRSIRILFR